MAQDNMNMNPPLTAAERDAQFIEAHPVQGRIVQAGAALTGAGDALNKTASETSALINKTYEPGDQRNIQHPLEKIEHGIANLKSGIGALVEPGDMRIENSPHPVNKTMQLTTNKLEEIHQAGAIEGARIGVAAAVGPVLDALGPSGKLKTAANVLEEVADASKVARLANHVNDAATNAFVHEATARTEKQLIKALDEYERTARAAKTYGEALGHYEGHGDALVRFQIASIKLDELKHGGDASINNPVIADLTKKGIESEHFYSTNVMNELKRFNPNQSQDHQAIAAEFASYATKAAHENRLNSLLEPKEGVPLTRQQAAEVNVGLHYGPDAAANARELMANSQDSRIREIYPEHAANAERQTVQPEADKPEAGKPETVKPGNDRVSLNDAISHLAHPDAKTIVLARIVEQKEQVNQHNASQHQAGVELV